MERTTMTSLAPRRTEVPLPDPDSDLKRVWADFVLYRHAQTRPALAQESWEQFRTLAQAETRWLLAFSDENGARLLTREAFDSLTRARIERIARHMSSALAEGRPAWSHRKIALIGLSADDPLYPLTAWAQSDLLRTHLANMSGQPHLTCESAALWQFDTNQVHCLRQHETSPPGSIDVIVPLNDPWRLDWGGGINIESGENDSIRLVVPTGNRMILLNAGIRWGIGTVLSVSLEPLTLVRLRFQPEVSDSPIAKASPIN
jgi:hypothetical protein